jgi:cyclopropane fatty-acyl-phospholipid synthase-like methyltransferase
MKEHWDKVYEKTAVEKLGWFEENAEPSLRLINQCNLTNKAAILNAGTGASTLVDELLNLGFNNIIATDISPVAIEALKKRLGPEKCSKVKWILDDLCSSEELHLLEEIDLWHDRAVLHFFLKQAEQDAYFRLLKSLVKKNGFVVIAAFNLNGAKKCSGLPIYRYNQAMLEEKLGKDFLLKTAFDYTYTMPSGDTRTYIYTLFQRTGKS